MKKILLISAILLSAVCYKAEAQLSVNINIGRQPAWGPVGYNHVDYYYLPDLDVYYDVPRGMFVYFDLGRWNFGASLPARYGHYDLYRSYKVVVNSHDPWLRNTYYRSHYAGYRGRHQDIIRDSRDSRYVAARERYHPEHNNRAAVAHNDHRDVRHDDRRDVRHDDHRDVRHDDRGTHARDKGNDSRHEKQNHDKHDRH